MSTGKFDETYEHLSSGDFDPHEEMRKLEILNKNLSKQKLAQEEQERRRLRGEN